MIGEVITPLHLGAMHPFEQFLTLLLAVGPFVVLGVVVVLRRRADDRAAALEAGTPASADQPEAQRER